MRRILTSLRRAPAPHVAALVIALATGAACGGSDAVGAPTRPTVVVTTGVLGDVVTAALGDLVDTAVHVEVIMPVGADPHEYAPSARDAEAMEQADLLVVNGLDAEGAMSDLIANVADGGTPVFTATDAIGDDLLAGDPHIWLDPVAMAAVVAELADPLVAATGLDTAQVEQRISAYVAALEDLDATMDETLSVVAPERRSLVTNHDSLGYFARRYGFTVDGTVISSVSTDAEASAADLEALAALIRERDIPAIFVETTEPDRLAAAVAAEVGGDVAVVELFTGSLGEPGSGAATYLDAMATNADRIAAALG